MNELIKKLTLLSEYGALEQAVRDRKTCAIFGIDSQKPYFADLLQRRLGKRAFIVVPDERAAHSLIRTLDALESSAFYFPPKEYHFRDVESASRFEENQRIQAIEKIRRGQFASIVIPAEALCALTLPPSDCRETVLTVGENFDYDSLPKILTDYGYESFPKVEGPGQFSIRGEIVDIFPPTQDFPYRIEFFDETIDTISLFDVASQRRTEQKDLLRLTPAKEYTQKVLEGLKTALDRLPQTPSVRKDAHLIEQGILPRHDRYLPLFYSQQTCILDYCTNDDLLFIFDYKRVLESIEGFTFRIEEDLKQLTEEGFTFVDKPYSFSKSEIISRFTSALVFETLTSSLPELRLDRLFEFRVFPTSNTNLKTLPEEIEQYLASGYDVTVAAITEDHRRELAKIYAKRNVTVCCNPLPFGFELPEVKQVVLSLRQKGERKLQKKPRFERGEKIKAFSDIHTGDYVVHENYGVGLYDGIHKIETDGITKDFIKIKFAGTDTLYVPCDNLDLISKYIGAADDVKVKLNRLGGTDWQKTKQRTKKAVRDLADKLIVLYGQRLNSVGHAFSPDTDWQKNFEEDFEFEETEDQIRCIEEIKGDMERPVPMDRLLCGDVGFGKTEVALRAIFKCVMDSKQAALLAPTTILAYQHYNTIRARFREYPVRIELISRFRTAKQQEAILRKLKNGEIDVIIGTHRLVQKDIGFKDLGLIVIDEEQRFGVEHKEYLKEKAIYADILSLSATPIPRTLTMSMSGIRDISVINEAPLNRFPIMTYVSEFNEGLVCDAIRKELSRGGQCYYLHNRIETIYKTAQWIEDRTGARVRVAHGKMSQDELSHVWQDLVDGDIDVLVCTTIIETGVDVPNCNTLIIEDADRLGLAQLHQIRGRVGRTDRRAYAFFTFRKGKILSNDAYKRLMTIKEFTEFGSGLKIAMRDLEIRGAGDVLGAEQSGHLISVGFDMYMKLLEEAVKEQRGEVSIKQDCTVEMKIDAYVPDEYIRDPESRIEVYKLISGIRCCEDESEVTDELIDRFGEPPRPVVNLLFIARIRYKAVALGIVKISEYPKGFLIYPDRVNPKVVSELASVYRRDFLFSAANPPYITLKCEKKEKDLEQFLGNLAEIIDKCENV
ncbi:MAG: transcription-repair coupling factor [Clostridia bacterium]|nr:transcription-repair coupling factor [Clostridia bacterium]